ncbi:MAG: general secretion pathway protein GspN [Pseudoxanthomonas sp.]
MRVDTLPPRTRLLATIAGWAMLVWVLGLFGLGGRIAPLSVDPSRLADLPAVRPAAASRVGPPEQYVEVAARPAFDSSRRPRPFFIEGPQAGEGGLGFDFALTSVLIAPALQMAILQPVQGGEALRVKLGEELRGSPGWRLVEVQPRSVVFDGPDGRRTLELRADLGGGEAPPARSVLAQAALGDSGAPDQEDDASPPPTSPGNAAPTPSQSSAAPATAAAGLVTTAAGNAQSPERQIQQIRERIEARRAQLRQQQEQSSATEPPSSPPDP